MKQDDLDALLALSAPPARAGDPAVEAAIHALIEEVRAEPASRVSRWRHRPWAIAAVLLGATVTLGAAAYGAANQWLPEEGPFGWLPPDVEAAAGKFEWQTTLPDGTLCVTRLTGFDMTANEIATVDAALRDPDHLLALDAGAVRAEFLADYDADPDKQQITDRATWESWINAAYAAVKTIDAEQGRGDVADAELGVFPGTAENEIFLHSYMRLVLDGLSAQGREATTYLNPEVACEVAE